MEPPAASQSSLPRERVPRTIEHPRASVRVPRRALVRLITKANFGVVADNPGLIDINHGGAPTDWTHMNGIDYNGALDQIIVSAIGTLGSYQWTGVLTGDLYFLIVGVEGIGCYESSWSTTAQAKSATVRDRPTSAPSRPRTSRSPAI